jgi:hypothetical protein
MSDNPATKDLPLLTIDTASRLPLVGVGAVAVAHLLTLVFLGRIWWCTCGQPFLWTSQAWGSHTSQHLADPYSFSHILHGVGFFYLFNWGVLRRRPLWGLVCAAAFEAGWEIFENTPFTINRYRNATAATGYTGDTIANSLADLGCALIGWMFARRLGWRWSLALFLVLEIGCALWIRDNLTLNIVMFLHPFQSIKDWQGAMAPGM